MRAFLLFLALLIGALLLAAAFTYPAWLAVEMLSEQPVHRVMHRLAMLFALVGLLWLARRQHLGNREAMGYGVPRAQFVRELGIGFGAGIALLLPFIVLLFALELRVPKESLTAGSLLALVPITLLSGLVVAFIEETFFRGVLQTAVARESGTLASLVLPSGLYAAVHFLGGRLKVPPADIGWDSGFHVFANLFEKYARPELLVDSLAALFAVGLLLAVVRWRTRGIAACIGLHASWVMLIGLTRTASLDNAADPQSWLTGAYDGVIGWGAFFWTLLVLALVGWRLKPTSRSAPLSCATPTKSGTR